MNDKAEILVIASDPETRKALSSILQTEGLKSAACFATQRRSRAARQQIRWPRFLRTPPRRRHIPRSSAGRANSSHRKVPVVVTSRLADWDEYLEALRHGAVDLIPSPCKPSDVSSAIAQAHREAPGARLGGQRLLASRR